MFFWNALIFFVCFDDPADVENLISGSSTISMYDKIHYKKKKKSGVK